MESSEAATAFAALSVDARLNLMRLLMAEGPNGLPAGDLSGRLGLPASTTSFHLAALERAGLTQSTRQGRQIVHAARIAGVRRLLGFLTETCCGGRPELCGDLARSIMAEAIMQKYGGGRFHAYSAGSDPIAEPNAEVTAKLQTLGHDTDNLRSKSWDEFTGPIAPRMDF